jgi:hypothetical protein
VRTDPAKSPPTIAELERECILARLSDYDGNRTHTAKSLGISIRCLRNKLQAYSQLGIEVRPPRTRLETLSRTDRQFGSMAMSQAIGS